MKGKINIVHIRDSCGIYGAERVILTLGNNLNKDRYHLTLIALDDQKGLNDKFIVEARRVGFEVIPVPVKGRVDFKALPVIRNILKEKLADIIHSHDYKSNLYTILSSMAMGIKKVVTSHGATKESFKKRLYLLLDDRIFYQFFHNIIAVSEKIGVHLSNIKIPSKKISVIPNGIDVSIIQSSTKSDQKINFPNNITRVFGVIGRLTPDKGHRYFIDAFIKVIEKHPSVAALFVGGGPEKDKLVKQIECQGLTEKIILTGERDDMDYIYGMLDCVVIPSLREGLPYSLLEAMAKKIPVIATSVGDIPRLILPGQTGYLIPATDISALGKCMDEFLNSPEAAKVMAIRGYELLLEKYSAKKMVHEYEKVYESIIS